MKIYLYSTYIAQWNLVIKRSVTRKPCYKKVTLPIPAPYTSSFVYPDTTRNPT